MLRNYLKVALRNFRRHASYTFINTSGLAVGMACCLLIALYVHHELSFDQFNEHADRIHRVVQEQRFASVQKVAVMSSPVAPALLSTFPEIEHAVRFYASKNTMRLSEARSFEATIAYTDSTVFDVFTLPMLKGLPAQALVAPNSIVLSETTAHKFFGEDDPLGKTVQFDDRNMLVTGVMLDIPSNAHFDFEALASYSSLDLDIELHSWGRNSMWTYLLLRPGASPKALEAKFPSFIEDHIERSDALEVFSYYLQPLTDIHLHSHMVGEIDTNNDISTVYIFSAIALFILLIASINYINLATARSSQRMREVGMRKVLGAFQGQLVRQFLGESLLMTLIALAGAILLMAVSLPFFNDILGIEITLNTAALVSMVGFFVIIGLLAGAYPAFHLARFRPLKVLKGSLPAFSGGASFRKVLVVVQFTISIALIVAVGVAYQQLRFIQDKDLGFDKEHLISFEVRGDVEKSILLKETFIQLPQVISAATSGQMLGQGFPSTTFRHEGAPEDEMQMVSYFDMDPEFIETMGMTLVAGRNLSRHIASDMEEGIVINESAVRAFGWASPEEAIGKRITQGWTPEILGVVKDFHFATLHQSIDPLILWWDPPQLKTVTVRTSPGDISATLAALEASWNEILPDQSFSFTFVDDHLNTLYRSDKALSNLFGLFAVFAIFIACLGLLGLTSFTAQQRRKEIGVRKVLGASVQGIVALLSQDILRLVSLSFIIAAPVAYFVMNRWLEEFAYHIEPTVWIFILAGLAAFGVALLTVSYQSIKAALSNPVKSLRYE